MTARPRLSAMVNEIWPFGAMVIAAVTGWGQVDDRRRTAEAGFDRHLVKPVDPADLLKWLASE